MKRANVAVKQAKPKDKTYKLAAALGNPPELWLNPQHAVELWDVRNEGYEQEARNVRLVKPLSEQVSGPSKIKVHSYRGSPADASVCCH